ncbi:diguanylate cyclase, partial [bacterium]|nr:diguanylate cyclase [bacterium]
MNAHKDVKSIFIFNYIVLFSGIVFSLYYAHFLFVDLKEQSVHKNLIAINTLSSKNVNAHLQNVADSVEALGESYKKLFLQQQTLTQKHPMYHHNFLQNEKITFYSDFLNQEEYPFQSDHVSMVLSNLHQDKETIANELNLFHRLAPALESIYNSFHFSWVYFTTVNDFLAIYPYVPFINAIDVYQPTQQHFYKAADFANKRVGWEEPYSDLAGGGILVTASYPVYDDNEKLLGVASHDITLDKIAESILNTTIIYEGTVSFLLSKEGKVISSNDERYRGELKEQDSHTYRGSFYYRTQKDAGKNGLENIKVSK